MGSVLVQTGTLEPRALLIGVPIGLMTGCIIWINQFPDAEADAAGGKRTLVVRLGLAMYTTRHLFRHYRSRTIKAAMAGTIQNHLAAGLLMCLGVWLAV